MKYWSAVAAFLMSILAIPAQAQSPGVTATEIRLGQSMPYSGNASAYGLVGKAMLGYFEKINKEQGGVNGRKINLISLDDGFSPPKTVEATRKLVEQDDILAIFGTMGTAPNTAIHRYLNSKKIPHLLVTTGATKWADPKNFPYTTPGMISYQTEGKIYARYLLQKSPNARIAILMQNDDFGRDYLEGFKLGLGANAAKMIIATQTYELTDPTIDSQLANLKASGADAFFSISLGKFSSQSIKRVKDLDWKLTDFIVPTSSVSIKGILTPAGLDAATGIVTSSWNKNVADPTWANDAGMATYLKFLKEYMSAFDPNDSSMVTGYNSAIIMTEVLRRCGNDLSRDNVMKQFASIKNMKLDMLLPGIEVSLSPDDFRTYKTLQMMRFDGQRWNLFGQAITE
ncbi:MAG: ABC transporter substrate-binding protein [Hyphomicrobiaceae bacterium]|nr:ABC transporter substrate-binding protein [Hyphomicrobiaceae bacterium]